MVIDFNVTFLDLMHLIKSWDEKDNIHKSIYYELGQLSMFFDALKKQGITRKQTYNLIQKALKANLSDFQEIVLWEFETSVTGDVDKKCIQKFRNEYFKNSNEFVSYVRSKEWLS